MDQVGMEVPTPTEEDEDDEGENAEAGKICICQAFFQNEIIRGMYLLTSTLSVKT